MGKRHATGTVRWRSETCQDRPLHEQLVITAEDAVLMFEKLAAACTVPPVRPAVAVAGAGVRLSLRSSAAVAVGSFRLGRWAARTVRSTAAGAVDVVEAVAASTATESRDALRSSSGVQARAVGLVVELISDSDSFRSVPTVPAARTERVYATQ